MDEDRIVLDDEIVIERKLGNRKLSYIKESIINLTFLPQILDTYPKTTSDKALLTSLPEFSFTTGLRVRTRLDELGPEFFTFVLTNEYGSRIYGACLKIYEETLSTAFQSLEPTVFTSFKETYTPKILCIISKYSFIEQYKEILTELYRYHLVNHNLPIEVVLFLLLETDL